MDIEIKLENLDLTTRAINVCLVNDMVTISDLMEYYNSGKSFIELRNCGVTTEMELVTICENNSIGNTNLNVNLTLEQNNDLESQHYKNLTKIDLIFNTQFIYTSYFIHFLHLMIYFQNKNGKSVLMPFLLKSRSNVLVFFQLLKKFLIKNDESDYKNRINKYKIVIKFIDDIYQILQLIKFNKNKFDLSSLDLIKLFKIFFGDNSVTINEYLVDKDNFKFFKFYSKIISENILDKREYYIFFHLYGFNKINEKKTIRTLASELNLSAERIRQLSENIKYKIHNRFSLFQIFMNNYLNYESYNLDLGNDSIIINESFVNNANNIEKINFSFHYYSFLFQVLLIKSHKPLIYKHKEMKNYFFIKNDVWNQFYFKEFYHDLRKKVRIVRKSYILSCNDYLKQFSINKTNKEIERIKVIISKIANKEFNLKTDEASNIYFERTSKKIIPEYIYEILYKTSHPMHKSEITRQLRLIYPELNLSIFEVSNNIKRVKDIVCYGHTSTYGLKAWGGYYGYDLKEMIEKVLRKYQRPMHISELFGILNKLTIYFSNSAIYHMKKDKSKRFIFFRGGFIGLKNIKYKSEDLNIYTNTWKLTQIVNLYIKSLSFPLSYSNILIKIKQNFKINKFQLKIVLDNIINRGWLKAISHNKYLYDGRQKK